eukprot:6095461-Amphidinium_carterae.1
MIKLLLVHVTKLSEQQLQAVKRIEGEDVYRLLYACCLVQPLHPFGPAEKEAWSREYRERARVADVGVAERLSLVDGKIDWHSSGLYQLGRASLMTIVKEALVSQLVFGSFVALLEQLSKPDVCGLPPMKCAEFFKKDAAFKKFVAPMYVFKDESEGGAEAGAVHEVKRILRANSNKTTLVCRADTPAVDSPPASSNEQTVVPLVRNRLNLRPGAFQCRRK